MAGLFILILMKILFLLIILSVTGTSALCQKHDNIWLTGYEGGTLSPPNDSFGITILDFSNQIEPKITGYQNITLDIIGANTSMCDSAGNLLFYTNGVNIYNKNHKVMDNGNSINPGDMMYGAQIPQSVIGLERHGYKNQYHLISVEDGPGYPLGVSLRSNLIDIGLNNGLGKVLDKRKTIIQDSLIWGRITCAKHENGRDWWLIATKFHADGYYSVLIQPDTIIVQEYSFEIPFSDGGGGVCFSPNGKYYAYIIHRVTTEVPFIMLFDFDRCSGQLSNQRRQNLYNPIHFQSSVAFSPDSKLLYAFDDRVAYQYDLTAPDIFASETIIAEWNGSLYYNIWPNNWWQGQLAPDGRIYVNNSNSNVNLHRIRFPNRKGVACQFVQNDIATPTINADDMPNLPNYRLGPVDGSACDTLGLDNHPLSRFRWDFEDTLTPLRVTFTDLSAYEPNHWKWLFGDGVVYDTTASGEVFHSFPAPGLYTVCLVASNINSTDTLCYAIQVGEMVGSTAPAEPAHHIAAFPNPVYQLLSLQVQGIADWQRVDAVIYDQLGRVAGHTAWRGGTGQINMAELPGGVYSLGITVDGRAAGIVRVVKI